MTTSFPAAIDTFPRPVASDSLSSPSHSVLHTNTGDAVTAIQQEIGVTGETDPGTIRGALLNKAPAIHTHNYAPTSHGHAITDVTGLRSELDALAAGGGSIVSDKLMFGSGEFEAGNVGVAPVRVYLGSVLNCWSLPKTPSGVSGIGASKQVPATWSGGTLVGVNIDYAMEVAHNQGNVQFSVNVRASLPNVDESVTGGGQTFIHTGIVSSPNVRRREMASVIFNPPVTVPAGSNLFIQIQRNNASGDDTQTQGVCIVGVAVLYEASV